MTEVDVDTIIELLRAIRNSLRMIVFVIGFMIGRLLAFWIATHFLGWNKKAES